MEFREKIDKILEVKQLKLWKLAEESGLNSTLEKAYKENRELSDKKLTEFLEKMGISRQWWRTGKGEIFSEKPTSVPKEDLPDNGGINLHRWVEDLRALVRSQEKEIKRLEKELKAKM